MIKETDVPQVQAFDPTVNDWVDVEILKTDRNGRRVVEIHASSPKGTPGRLFWANEIRFIFSRESVLFDDMLDGEILTGEPEWDFLRKISKKLVKKGWKKDD